MDKIILGILMLKRLTAYEIRNIIRKNFKAMCSDSLGSIQASLKKMVAEQLVTCSEFVEKGVNKKQYSITDAGRIYFMEWLKTPADMSKAKNMDLGKILFMGLVPERERITLLDEIIRMLEEELDGLLEIHSSIEQSKEMGEALAKLERDPEYCSGIQKATENMNMLENVKGISDYEIITLQYGLDSTRFQIEWFKRLRKKQTGSENGREEKEGREEWQ